MATDVGTVLFDAVFNGETGLDDRWQLMRAGDFCADDGVVSTSGDVLAVAPGARHPKTGEPAFTKAETGWNGHLKWLALSNEAFSTAGGRLRVRFTASARTFGTSEHPFGDDVEDPLTDLRLGAGTLNVLDFESGLIFDFWITQKAIYPFYERLRMPDSSANHAAFGSIAPPIPRVPDSEHEFSIVVDASAGTARWGVDGDVVATVETLGPPAPGWTPILYHGGTPSPATPRRLQLGLGLLTLLDAALTQPDRGLVDLGTGYVPDRTFRGGPHVWGQGVELKIRRITVERLT